RSAVIASEAKQSPPRKQTRGWRLLRRARKSGLPDLRILSSPISGRPEIGARLAMTASGGLPPRPCLTLRHEKRRGVAQGAGGGETIVEAPDLLVGVRVAGRRRSGALHVRHGALERGLGLLLRLAVLHAVAQQELQAVIAQADRRLSVPQRP